MNLVNKVFEVRESFEKIRVIWIDKANDVAYYVKLESNTAMPKYIKLTQLLDKTEYKAINDPYEKYIDESSIADKHRIQRDRDWEMVISIWEEHKLELLGRSNRGAVIRKFSETNNISEKKMRRILSRFFQRGMNRNALLTDYSYSGGKGKDRVNHEVKRGRPRNVPLYGEESIGINIDEKIKAIFQSSIKKHYSNRRKAPLKHAYRMMLIENFSDRIDEDSKLRYEIWDKERIPTYRQFEYWFRKLTNKKDLFVSRNSEQEYQLKLRELLGNSNMETFGPGHRYQIDATVADVYLLSSFNRKDIIGRPVVYIVADVYSRMITGVYIGLEGPSWTGAMLALDNVLEDKVEFCKKYGVEIDEEDWPQSYLPEIILADRGEFEGYNVENMVNNLNITIENTPPYRGDLKGIVERKFNTFNGKIKYLSPGAVRKEYNSRVDKDYRLDAVYTLDDFIGFMLEAIVGHNTSLINHYNSELGLISDQIPPIPSEIWRWGMKNRRTGFISRDREYIRMNLLPRDKATITRSGIRFNKAYYSSGLALKGQWFLTSNKRSVDIVYDPYCMNSIYVMVPGDNETQFEECILVDGLKKKYENLTIHDLKLINSLEKEIMEAARHKSTTVEANSTAKLISITKAAQKNVNISNKSDRERLKNIRDNRRVEKKYLRKDGVFSSNDNEFYNDHLENSTQTLKPKSKLSLLTKKRDEKRGKQDE